MVKVLHRKRDFYNSWSTVYIGRPSKWGNPFKIGEDGSRKEVIAKYKDWIVGQRDLIDSLHELKGKDLVCYCAPLPCHGDVLLELVEAEFGE